MSGKNIVYRNRGLDEGREVRLDGVYLDWLTVTTWENDAWRWWSENMTPIGEGMESWREARRMQFDGYEMPSPSINGGTLFIGTSPQNLCMMVFSGAAADDFGLPLLREWRGEGRQYNVSRIDIQVTRKTPRSDSLWRLFNRAKLAGKTASFIDSGKPGDKVATVGMYARKGERYVRVYEKRIDGDSENVLTRFEVEYKQKRATATANAIISSPDDKSAILRNEVLRLSDKWLDSLFGDIADHTVAVKVKVVKGDDKKKKWLLEQVLPAFAEYVADHDGDGVVAEAFIGIISKARGHDRIA